MVAGEGEAEAFIDGDDRRETEAGRDFARGLVERSASLVEAAVAIFEREKDAGGMAGRDRSNAERGTMLTEPARAEPVVSGVGAWRTSMREMLLTEN